MTSYKVIGKSTGDSEWTIEALIQAADDGNDIINMSLGTYKSQGYSFSYGTGLSAPAVSAALADIHAMDTDMECQETISYLKNGAVDLGIAGTDIQFGSGKINLKASLDLVDNR